MLNINTILLPIDFAATSERAGRQAVTLARHFHSRIVMLHMIAQPLAMPGGREFASKLAAQSREELERFLAGTLGGLEVKRLVLEGDPATGIVQTALDEGAKLIVMPTHGFGPFRRFLLGSVTAKVLHDSRCPVWVDAHERQGLAGEFSIHRILCAVDLTPHSRNTVCWAGQIAAEFEASLTIAHITAGMEIFGPGGAYAVPEWRDELMGYAREQIEKLKQEMGVQAEVYVDSGSVPVRLGHAANRTGADLLVIGARPSNGGARAGGYDIIRESRVPVLNV